MNSIDDDFSTLLQLYNDFIEFNPSLISEPNFEDIMIDDVFSLLEITINDEDYIMDLKTQIKAGNLSLKECFEKADVWALGAILYIIKKIAITKNNISIITGINIFGVLISGRTFSLFVVLFIYYYNTIKYLMI